MTRIFISHSHADKAFATRLADALRERGFEPWIDHEGIRGGARWSTSIQEGLDACQALVLVLSPSAMDSSNVEDEWQYALDEGTPILPVRIEPTKVHFQLQRIQHVDFHERAFETAVRELEQSLHEAVAESRPGAAAAGSDNGHGTVASEATTCPYRGLHAFREQDAAFFFGREVFAERLVETLDAKPMVGVIGPSGSGKSSVVMAGMLPRLRETRVGDVAGGNATSTHPWTVLQLRPGAEPFHALASVLVPLLEGADSRTDRLIAIRKMTEALADGTLDVGHVLADVRRERDDLGAVLFIVDQFEELYTLCPDVAVQRRFQDLLFETAFGANGSGPVRLALTLRADFMGHATAYRPFSDAIQDHNVILGPMNADELTRVIARPAQLQGRSFEPGLVERIRRDVGEEAGSLPLLEFALTKLWEGQVAGKLTHASYEALGQVEGAVARHADAIYDGLAEADRELARQVIVQMVRPGEGTEDTRRIARREELGDEGWGLVRRLADARLVVTNRDEEGRETAEVVHEALIRTWGRLKEWMQEDRRFRMWQERLRFAIRQWEGSGRDVGALLRGVPLAEAEQWADERGSQLSGAESEFVQLGLRHRDHREAAAQARVARERALEQRSRKWLRWTAAVLLVAALVGFGLATVALREREHSERESERADRNALEAQTQALVAQSQALMARGQRDIGLAVALEAVVAGSASPSTQLALSEAAYAPGTRHRLDGFHADLGVLSVALSRDGSRLLTTGDPSGDASKVALWDTASGEVMTVLEAHGEAVNNVAFSPDERLVASVSDDALGDTPERSIIVWDLATGEALRTLPGHTDWVLTAAFSPDGRRLVTIQRGGIGYVWSLASGERLITFEGAYGNGRRVAFLPDGRSILYVSDDFELVQRELESGEILRRWARPASSLDNTRNATIRDFDLAPGGERVAIAYGERVSIWHLGEDRAGIDIATGGNHTSVALLPDGRHVLIGKANGTLLRVETQSGRIVDTLLGHGGSVRRISVDAAGGMAASAGKDGVRIWWITPAIVRAQTFVPDVRWTDVDVSPDGTTLRTSRAAGRFVQVWGAEDLRPLAQLEAPGIRAHGFVGDPRARHAVTWFGDLATIWDLEAGTPRGEILPGGGGIAEVVMQESGDVAWTSSIDGVVQAWTIPDGREIVRFNHRPLVADVRFKPLDKVLFWGGAQGSDVALSADGSRVLAAAGSKGSGARELFLWDAVTGALVHRMRGHDATVRDLELLPGDDHAVSIGGDDTLRVWDLDSGEEVERIVIESVRGLEISADGRRAAIVTTGNGVALWDTATWALIRRYASGSVEIHAARFSPDGESLVTVDHAGGVVLWAVHDGFDALLEWTLAHRYVPALTCHDRARLTPSRACEDGALPPDPVAVLASRVSQEADRATPTTPDRPRPSATTTAASSPPAQRASVPTLAPRRALANTRPMMEARAFRSVALSADGSHALLGTSTGGLLPLDLETEYLQTPIVGPNGPGLHGVAAIVPLGADRMLATGYAASLTEVNMERATVEDPIKVGSTVFAADRSPGGDLVALGTALGISTWTIGVTEVYTAADLGHVTALRFTPDGTSLVAGTGDGRIERFTVDEGGDASTAPALRARRELSTIHRRHVDFVRTVAVSPDGAQAASGDRAGLIFWDLRTDSARTELEIPQGVFQARFSPDGRWLATSTGDGRLQLRDPNTGEERRRLEGHTGVRIAFTFTPDGCEIVSAGDDHRVLFWDLGVCD